MNACSPYCTISDELFEFLKQLIPVEGSTSKGGRPTKDLRGFLEALRWKVCTGAPWRSMPLEFGPWQTVYARYKRWERDGALDAISKLFTSLKENAYSLYSQLDDVFEHKNRS